METLPGWFWILYYAFLLLTLLTAIICLVKWQRGAASAFVIILTLAIPIVTFVNAIGRFEHMNEWQYFVHALSHGAIWATFVTISYGCLAVWWGSFFRQKIKETR
ncbi:MAG: hypothetical protein UHX00_04935 [Caryophanon sp.]|nr:hypothetical protein [Caryophanon sp.]